MMMVMAMVLVVTITLVTAVMVVRRNQLKGGRESSGDSPAPCGCQRGSTWLMVI